MTSTHVSADLLTPALRKHADPKAPLPLRAMGAKLLVPMSPPDAACLLFLLSSDPEDTVRDQAVASAENFPEKIALTALRDDGLPGEILGWFTERLATKDALLELLILNQATPDDALAEVVTRCSGRMAELIAQNQLRLLRHEGLLRNLLLHSQASRSVLDGAADFAIRSGIYLPDVEPLLEAHRRIHGNVPMLPPTETAIHVLDEFAAELKEERGDDEEALPEERKLTVTQRILQMSVAEKIKLATLGNKEARTILLRDTNKLVCVAAVHSPRITESEILGITNSRTVHEEVLRVILLNRDWMKLYQVKLNLVKNPKTPLPTALRFLPHVRPNDLKDLQKNKNVPMGVQTGARNLLMKQKKL